MLVTLAEVNCYFVNRKIIICAYVLVSQPAVVRILTTFASVNIDLVESAMGFFVFFSLLNGW